MSVHHPSVRGEKIIMMLTQAVGVSSDTSSLVEKVCKIDLCLLSHPSEGISFG